MTSRPKLLLVAALLSCSACKHSEKAPEQTGWSAASQYALTLSSTATLPEGDPFELKLSSGLDVYPLLSQGDSIELEIALRKPSFDVRNEQDRSSFDSLAQELARPAVVHLKRGKLVELRVAPGTSGMAVSLLRTVAAQLQWPAQTTDSSTVRVVEHDATGQYAAEVRREGQQYTKQKLVYEKLLLAGTVNAEYRRAITPQVVRSKTQMTLDRGLISKLTLDEHLKSKLQERGEADVHTSLSLKRAAEPPVSAAIARAELVSNTVLVPANQAYRDEGARRAFDAMRLAGRSYETLLKELEGADDDPAARLLLDTVNGKQVDDPDRETKRQATREQLNVFSAMVALLRQDPTALDKALASIHAGSEAAPALLGAIAMVSTPRAHAALLAIIEADSLALPLRAEAALSLIRSPSPTPEMVQGLIKLAADPQLAEHAVYGLGTAARLMRERGDSAGADKIAQILIGELERASDRAHKVRALRGIANSGNALALPRVKPLLHDENELLRAAALQALHLMELPEVDSIYARQLQDEKSVNVKRALLSAIQDLRTPTEVVAQALVQLARADESANLRRQAVTILAAWQAKLPNLRAALEKVSREESDPSIVQIAAAALQEKAI